jgi:hypothetical protein
MHSFVKLSASLLESTLWDEADDIRIVWITLLCMADLHGRIGASVPGIAKRGRVSLDSVERALDKFQKPDKYSRTKDEDGKRVKEISGGWQIINYVTFRDKVDEDGKRESKRIWAEKQRKRELQLTEKVELRRTP